MPKEIVREFPDEFKEKMLSGEKTMFTEIRFVSHEVGDYFHAFGEKFVITELFRQTIAGVSSKFYRQEGFRSPSEFVWKWERSHPQRKWNPALVVCCHVFEKENIS